MVRVPLVPDSPRLSVIMPAHNAERYVAEAIESILRQSFADFELIVVNDASRDRTAAIVDGYCRADGRVRMLTADVRSAAEARNRGLREARGEFVALMDADDVAYPTRLEAQLAAAEGTPEAVLWGCYMQRITPEGARMAPVRVGCTTVEAFEALDRTRSLVRCYATVAFFRRDVALDAGGFDPRFEPLEDSELWDRITAHGPALVVPEILQAYRQHDESLSVKKVGKQRRWFRFITKRYAARQAGRDLTLEAFERSPDRWRALRDLDDRLYAYSQRQARSFRIALARRRYLTMATAFTLMVASHPMRFVRRLFPGAPHI